MSNKIPSYRPPAASKPAPRPSNYEVFSNRPNPFAFIAGAFIAIALGIGGFLLFSWGLEEEGPIATETKKEGICKTGDCVKKRDKIRISYTGSLADGRVFESSFDGGRLGWAIIEVGWGWPPPWFHKALLGMRPGESKTFVIPWKEAYGPKTLTVEYVKEAFGKDIGTLKEGAEYELVPGTKVTISKIGAKTVTATVPSTHPLAGEELRYEVSVEENLGSTSEVIVTSPQPKIVGAAWTGTTTISDGPPPAREPAP